MNRPSPRPPATLPWWMVGIFVAAAGWAMHEGRGHPRSIFHGVVSIGFLLSLNALNFGLLLRASGRAGLPAAYRSFLRWVAAGVGLTALSGVYVLFHEVILLGAGPANPVGIADLLCMAAYPLFLFGLLGLPRADRSDLGPWRTLADSAVFVVGVGVPLWFFALQPGLGGLNGMERFVSLAFPGLAFAGIGAANFILLRCSPLPTPRAFNTLLGGLAVSWMADLVFALHVTERLQITNLTVLSNLINAGSLLLILVGAWWLRNEPMPARPPRPAAFSPIPMFTLVVTALWVARFLHVFDVDRGTLRNLLLGMIVLLSVILLREGLAAKDGIRQATEAATLALRARFEALVENSSDLILVLDPEGRITYASPAAARFLGQAPRGRPLGEFLHPEDRGPWETFLAGLLAAPGSVATRQWRMRDAQGDWRFFEASGDNLLGHPEVRGLVLNARDITQRRMLEDHLHQVLKMEALGRLAGGVSHDFNNMLSAILGNVELARMQSQGDPRLEARLARIEASARHGATLTARLLALTRRPSFGQTVLDPARFLAPILPLVAGILGDRIDLETRVEPGAGCFLANLDEVQEVLLTLAGNARDAMPEGGRFSLAFRSAEAPDPGPAVFLTPVPASSGSCVLLEVSDTGTGMDEEVRSHLFEPFYSTKGKAKGMGLTGVYGIVKAAGGGLSLDSEVGRGTTLRLWFPRVAQTPASPPAKAASTALQGSETLLLVEDEAPVREALQELLGSLGYQVHVAGDADQARTFLAGYPGALDLLVTDVIMPGDSGPKLAAEAVRARPGLRVLYISGYTAGELEAHGLAHPGALLLEKPFTREQIGRRLREVLA